MSTPHNHAHPRFYDLLQMGVGELKAHIRSANTSRERRRFVAGLIARDLAIILFAVLFISSITTLFGQVASSAAVASFVMLLSLRFVGYTYSNLGNLLTLVLAFCVLTFAPLLGAHASLAGRLAINLICLPALLIACVQDPRMGNGGVYGFSYVFLCGSLYDRALATADVAGYVAAMAIGLAICAFALHRHRDRTAGEGSLIRAISSFHPSNETTRFQLRAALGITFTLFVAQALGLHRIMWAGLAASSMLTPYGIKVRDRIGWRVGFTTLGCALFAVVFPALPLGLQGMIGIAAGVGCGLCSKYQWAQIFNSLGALLTAAPLLGIIDAPIVRVVDNVAGCLLALLFSGLFALAMQALPRRWRTPNETNSTVQSPCAEN